MEQPELVMAFLTVLGAPLNIRPVSEGRLPLLFALDRWLCRP